MSIKNVIICGLGALGITYAAKLKDFCNLRILADKNRIKKYKNNTPIFNDKKLYLDYITPVENFASDLIIIATKSFGLNSAINYIKNFVTNKTIIISLINGISSEKRILEAYPQAEVVRSFYIGHSAMAEDINGEKRFFQDGIGKIVFEKNLILEDFFKTNKIDYEVSNNIEYSQWVKLGVNIVLNQLSAIYKSTVGELRKRADYEIMANNLLEEVKKIAIAEKVDYMENYIKDVFDSANLIADSGKTSMYQDVIQKKKTELNIFSGEIILLGKKYGIETPYNQEIYNKIKLIEEEF